MNRSVRRSLTTLGLALTAALVASGCFGNGNSRESTPVPQPTEAQLIASGLAELPLAPAARRVDLTAPPFSHPTAVANPLFLTTLGPH